MYTNAIFTQNLTVCQEQRFPSGIFSSLPTLAFSFPSRTFFHFFRRLFIQIMKQIIFRTFRFFHMIFTQLFLRQYDLGMQFLCRQQMTSLSADDHLFRAVRSCDGDFIFPPDLMCNFFDILICGFRFLCINDMDIMILLYLARKSLYLRCIKYKDQGTLPDSPDNCSKCPSAARAHRQMLIFSPDSRSSLPCKDNIITVHQQIFLSALPFSALILSGTV